MKKSILALQLLPLALGNLQAKPLKVFILAGQSDMEGQDRSRRGLPLETRRVQCRLPFYLGCAKTFALMGKAFAGANLEMLKQREKSNP